MLIAIIRHVRDQFGVRVVVDRMSVPYLSEAKIDFVEIGRASCRERV